MGPDIIKKFDKNQNFSGIRTGRCRMLFATRLMVLVGQGIRKTDNLFKDCQFTGVSLSAIVGLCKSVGSKGVSLYLQQSFCKIPTMGKSILFTV